MPAVVISSLPCCRTGLPTALSGVPTFSHPFLDFLSLSHCLLSSVQDLPLAGVATGAWTRGALITTCLPGISGETPPPVTGLHGGFSTRVCGFLRPHKVEVGSEATWSLQQ